MSFRDGLSSDIDDVFLNPDDWADYREIGGEDVYCIVDWSSELDPARLVWVDKATIIARESDLNLVPGQLVTLDGEAVEVDSVRPDRGMVVIEACKHRA